ncbi:MAG: P1 family peptidase [Gemmataceae bacterium]|nr:P1 family peptidase [Gemmataceae bacterium]
MGGCFQCEKHGKTWPRKSGIISASHLSTQPSPGVAVGHTTLVKGTNVRTGVLPHADNVFREKVPGLPPNNFFSEADSLEYTVPTR